MKYFQAKIEEPGEWKNLEKNVPGGLSVIKAYDIKLHTLATNECQEIASKFEEKEKHSRDPESIYR